MRVRVRVRVRGRGWGGGCEGEGEGERVRANLGSDGLATLATILTTGPLPLQQRLSPLLLALRVPLLEDLQWDGCVEMVPRNLHLTIGHTDHILKDRTEAHGCLCVRPLRGEVATIHIVKGLHDRMNGKLPPLPRWASFMLSRMRPTLCSARGMRSMRRPAQQTKPLRTLTHTILGRR